MAEEKRQLKIVIRGGQAAGVAVVGPILSFPRSRGAGAKTDCRRQEGSRVPRRGFRLIDARHGNPDVLIGGAGILFKAIEDGVLEYAPPIPVGNRRYRARLA